MGGWAAHLGGGPPSDPRHQSITPHGRFGRAVEPGRVASRPAAECDPLRSALGSTEESTIRRFTARAIAVGLVVFGPVGACASVASAAKSGPQTVTICHATATETNPYVQITVDIATIVGHAGHGHSGVRADGARPTDAPHRQASSSGQMRGGRDPARFVQNTLA